MLGILDRRRTRKAQEASDALAREKQQRELNGKDKADAVAHLTALVHELRGEVVRLKEENQQDRDRWNAELEEQREDSRKAWSEVRRIQNKLLRVEAENRDLKQRVTTNTLQMNMIGEEVQAAKKSRTTDIIVSEDQKP